LPEHEVCKHNGDIVRLNTDLSEVKSDISEVKSGVAVLNADIKYIVKAVDELKICNTNLNACIGTVQLGIAGMPSARDLKKAMDKVATHDNYFTIIGAALLLLAAWSSGLLRDLVMFIISKL
jgi:hypothetical protein